MKKILLFAFAIFALIGCKSNEQRLAEECIKKHLKCPSTLKVVNFSSSYEQEKIDIDTVYHVCAVNERARTVRIDSIKQIKRIYPAHYFCTMSFDAQNLMGANVRNSELVVIENGWAQLWEDWFGFHYRTSLDSVWEDRSVKKAASIYSMYRGRWCSKNDFIE